MRRCRRLEQLKRQGAITVSPIRKPVSAPACQPAGVFQNMANAYFSKIEEPPTFDAPLARARLQNATASVAIAAKSNFRVMKSGDLVTAGHEC